MIAGVVTNQIRHGHGDECLSLIRDAVVPSLQEQPGFAGFVALTSPESGNTIGFSLWDSEANLAASESSRDYLQQIAKLGSV
jgi:quinol monooxygenase YgiN